MRVRPDEVVRAVFTPEGGGTIRFTAVDAQHLDVETWGPGGEWLIAHADTMSGLADDPSGFDPSSNDRLSRLWRDRPGLRIPRTDRVLEALLPAILGQRVTVFEAQRAFRQIVTAYGEPAPGPHGLTLPPDPQRLAGVPYYDLHRCGVERARADTIRRAAAHAAQLEECATLPLSDARRRLRAIPGIGPWTTALVTLVALGDADAVQVGDLHLPNHVAWLLAGEERADDARMLDLLEPWHGHRARVVQLILTSALHAPRHGPKARITDHRSH